MNFFGELISLLKWKCRFHDPCDFVEVYLSMENTSLVGRTRVLLKS